MVQFLYFHLIQQIWNIIAAVLIIKHVSRLQPNSNYILYILFYRDAYLGFDCYVIDIFILYSLTYYR